MKTDFQNESSGVLQDLPSSKLNFLVKVQLADDETVLWINALEFAQPDDGFAH